MSVVEVEDHGPVRVLFLARPKQHNALSGELITGLIEALGAASQCTGVRALVLSGRGPSFCAGGDLAGGMLPEGGLLAAEQQRGQFGALLRAIYDCAVPVIAAVNGDALGGGCGIVAAADLAIADASARLGTPEVKVGLFPLVITAVLQRGVARKHLLEMMYTGERVTAEHAAAIGLVNRVAGEEGALAAAIALGEKIAANSRAVVSLGKRSFHEAQDQELGAALAMLNSRLTLNLLTEDASEGISAFIGRRPAAWKHR